MYFLTFSETGLHYPLTLYGKRDYLNSLIEENHNRLYKSVDKGNWILPNQHPLVQFITNMDLDLLWDDDYLFNYIGAKYQNVASLMDFTTVRNRGISHPGCLFPESDHEVLITIPFGDAPHSKSYYFEEVAYQSLFPLRTMYTSDIKQRWSITDLTTSSNLKKGRGDYTVVQLDPYALIIGYVRYYRDRIKKERYVGLTPESYVAKWPLVNFYLQHNQMEILNFTFDGVDGVEYDKPKWSMVEYKRWTSDYANTIKAGMDKVNPETFDHFLMQSFQINKNGDATRSLFPYMGISKSFMQLGWVYTFQSMYLSIKYIEYLNYVGKKDSYFKATVSKFLRGDMNSYANQIGDAKWKAMFINMFKDLKAKSYY